MRRLISCAGMNFYSVLGFFPLILEYFYTTTPIQIGVRGLCYPIAILAGACIVSFAMSYTRGHVREMFVIAAVMMTAFGGALAAATPFNPGFAIAMATLDSFGVGAIIVPSLTLALYACPDEYIGTTAALSLTTRFLGGSVCGAESILLLSAMLTDIRSAQPSTTTSSTVRSSRSYLPTLHKPHSKLAFPRVVSQHLSKP